MSLRALFKVIPKNIFRHLCIHNENITLYSISMYGMLCKVYVLQCIPFMLCCFSQHQIVKHKPSLWSFILQSETSDEEHFTDVGTATLTSFDDGTQTRDGDPKEEGHVTMPGVHMTQRGVGYRVAYRNPLYCGAEHTCLWELSQVYIIACHIAYILKS